MNDRIARLSVFLDEGIRKARRTAARSETGLIPDWAHRLANQVSESVHYDAHRLADVLARALSTAAERIDDVSIAVTGAGWLGASTPALERVLSDLVANAQQEIMLTTYCVTPGSERVWSEIERAAATGIRVIVVVDHLVGQQDETRSLLLRLASAYRETFSLYDFVADRDSAGLHAKVLVADRSVALVGSANLTHRGMVAAHEMAIVVRGPTAEHVAARVDALVQSAFVSQVSGGSDGH